MTGYPDRFCDYPDIPPLHPPSARVPSWQVLDIPCLL
jgi:hypothetical protein